MTPAIRPMTAAFLPLMASVEAIARLSVFRARGVAALLRSALASVPPVLSPVRPAQAMNAAPGQAVRPSGSGKGRSGGPDDGMTDADASGMEEAREGLAGDGPSGDSPATIATGEDRAEETGGPTQDTATLVDGATGGTGRRPDPNGAIS